MKTMTGDGDYLQAGVYLLFIWIRNGVKLLEIAIGESIENQ
jgi:hypothetical protein